MDVFCILEADKSAMSVFQEADLQVLPCKLKMAACPHTGGRSESSPSRAAVAGGSLGCLMSREWWRLDVGSCNVGVYCNRKAHAQGSACCFTYCLSSSLAAEALVKD